MKSIYLILTCSCTAISRIIRTFTGDSYTHASLAFGDDLHTMYSFSRKYPTLPLPAGFREEYTNGKFYRLQGNIPCVIMRKTVSNREYFRLKNSIYNMQCRADEYKYSLIGLLLCSFGIPLERKKRCFCSQFVARILRDNGIVSLPKPPSLMHPADFLGISDFETVYSGGFSDWNSIIMRENTYRLPHLEKIHA